MLVDNRKFLSLEGLRGVLALLVCAGHLGLNTFTARIGLTVRFGLSVDVFFALSGFVLAYSNFFGGRSFERFAIGRFARLYPLHLFTLAMMVVLVLVQGNSLDGPVLIESIFLVQNVGLPPNHWGFDFPSWSISVEVWVSLAFFLLCVIRSRRLLFGALAMTAAIAIAIPDLPSREQTNAFQVLNYGLLRGVAGFGVGMAAYLTFEQVRSVTRPHYWTITAGTGLAALAVLFCLPSWPFGANMVFYAVIFVVLVALPQMGEHFWLSRPIFVGAGAISYSVYLLHIPAYAYLAALFGDQTMRGGGKLLVFVVIVAISIVTHRYIEMPCQAWILRVTRRPQRHPAMAT